MKKSARLFSSLLFSLFFVTNLQPSWNALNGGGVYAAYYGAGNGVDQNGYYNPVSPGTIANYDERSSAPISAGINASSTGEYDDQGLFAFNTGGVSLAVFATHPLTYDFENEYGTAPVWAYIELNKDALGDAVYQYVPSSNPQNWHTENAAIGEWQEWTNLDNGIATGTLLSLASISAANPDAKVDRFYLTLGIGDAYHATIHGTRAWVDSVTIGDDVYNFSAAPVASSTDSDISTTTPQNNQINNSQPSSETVANGGSSGGFAFTGYGAAFATTSAKLANSLIISTSTSTISTSSPVITISHPKLKKKIALSPAPSAGVINTLPQTASAYEAVAQNGLAATLHAVFSAFWSAVKRFF